MRARALQSTRRMKMIAALFLVACTTSTPVDPGTGSGTPPRTVELHVRGTPAFLAYRDGDGPWQVLPGSAALQVTGPYQIVSACVSNAGDTFALLLDRTPQDGATLDLACADEPPAPPPPTFVTVTGTMQQSGIIKMGPFGGSSSGTAPWNFRLDEVPPGVNDLIALGGSSVLIERGFTVEGDMSLSSPIDLSAGSPLSTVPLVVNGAGANENLFVKVDLATAHSSINLASGPSTTVHVVPISALEPGDKESMFIDAQDGLSERTAYVDTFTGTQTTFDLPESFTADFSMDGANPGVSWQQLPSYDTLSWSLIGQRQSKGVTFSVEATQQWIATSGVDSLSLELPPDYDANLSLDTSAGYTALFATQSTTADGITYDATSRHSYGPGTR